MMPVDDASTLLGASLELYENPVLGGKVTYGTPGLMSGKAWWQISYRNAKMLGLGERPILCGPPNLEQRLSLFWSCGWSDETPHRLFYEMSKALRSWLGNDEFILRLRHTGMPCKCGTQRKLELDYDGVNVRENRVCQ